MFFEKRNYHFYIEENNTGHTHMRQINKQQFIFSHYVAKCGIIVIKLQRLEPGNEVFRINFGRWITQNF